MKLSGIFASIPTPFDYHGDLYIAKIRQNVERWNRTSLSGYLVCGAAGENALLTLDEKIRVWEQVAGSAKADVLLLAATAAGSVRETVQVSNRAAEIGYRAAVIAPFCCDDVRYSPLEMHALFCRAVADEARIPVVIERVTGSAEMELDADAVCRLAEHPNIIAILEGSSDPETCGRLIQGTPQEFQVLSGSACALAPSLAAGALGAILDFASAAPFLCLSVEEAVRTRQPAAAEELQRLVSPAAEALATRYGVAGLKYVLDFQGYYGGLPRLPLLPLRPQEKKHIEHLFREIRG